MRTITAKQFMSYMQNAWLAGMDMREVCFQLIVTHDIEVTPKMEEAMKVFYSVRNQRIDAFIPSLHSELKGH